jgi:hypothetical protein
MEIKKTQRGLIPPPESRNYSVKIRLSVTENDALRLFAEKTGMSISHVTRWAIMRLIEGYEK